MHTTASVLSPSNTIVVPLDGSPQSELALPCAIELARRTGGSLHLVRVHVPMTVIPAPDSIGITIDPAVEADIQKSARGAIEDRAKNLRTVTDLPVTATLLVGRPVDEICDYAAAHRARAIVCSTHGASGFAPGWLGSVADGLIRHAGCPVITLSAGGARRDTAVRKVLVLTDGSRRARTILDPALWYARAFGAEVDLLRVVAPPWVNGSDRTPFATTDPLGVSEAALVAKDALDEMASLFATVGLTVHPMILVHRNSLQAIREYVKVSKPDVVALATRGRGLSRLLLGSVADKLLRSDSCPTLTVCAPHFAGEVQEVVPEPVVPAASYALG